MQSQSCYPRLRGKIRTVQLGKFAFTAQRPEWVMRRQTLYFAIWVRLHHLYGLLWKTAGKLE